MRPIPATSPATQGASRARDEVSHRAVPANMNTSAVSRAIRGQVGTRLTSDSMPKDQPASTSAPTASATNAANCAKNRLGSALSELPMAKHATLYACSAANVVRPCLRADQVRLTRARQQIGEAGMAAQRVEAVLIRDPRGDEGAFLDRHIEEIDGAVEFAQGE